MATILSTPTRFDFIGNPITYKVRSSTHVAGSSFHRVKFIVPVLQDGIPTKTFELSAPVSGTQPEEVEFDISSCFRAVAETYLSTIAPLNDGDTLTYPLFSAKPYAFDTYVIDGQEQQGAPTEADTITTRLGAYSDYERRHTTLTPTLSRKPSGGELVCPGDVIVYPHIADDGSTPMSTATVISKLSPLNSNLLIAGKTYYIVRKQFGSTLFQFINSRDCLETIRAWGNPSEKMQSTTNQHVISCFERFDQFSRTIATKYIKPTEFSLSSGPVTYEWARWWAYEFCQATYVWMLHDSTWIPCNIYLSDSTTILDCSKSAILTVPFTVIPDLNGPLW